MLKKIKIGMPIKITVNNELLYGRIYGKTKLYWPNGEEGSYLYLLAITPDGKIIRGEKSCFNHIDTAKDYHVLIGLEKKESKPYFPYLVKYKNDYASTGIYEKRPIKFGIYPDSWFRDNGYLDINRKLFGEALSLIFTKELGEKHYFNQLQVIRNTSKDIPVDNRTTDERCMDIISPIKYNKNDFNYTMPYPHYKKSPNDYSTAFSKYPVNLGKKDFLLYFDISDNYDNLSLGTLENGTFIPYDFSDKLPGIHHINHHYEFINNFIEKIIKYKLDNHKPIINQDDMKLILKNFDINYQEKIAKIISILKQLKDEETNLLLETNTVGKVLELKKKK